MSSPPEPPPIPDAHFDSGGALPQLWIPFLVFAHVFALYWLLKAYILYNPTSFGWIRRKLHSNSPPAWQQQSGGHQIADEAADGGDDAASAMHGIDQPCVDSHEGGKASLGRSLSSDSISVFGEDGGAQSQVLAASDAHVNIPILRRLSSMVSQLNMVWKDVGCSYKQSNGSKVSNSAHAYYYCCLASRQ